MTTAQVAEWYGVDARAISMLLTRHRDELESNGYQVLSGAALTNFKLVQPESPQVKSARRQLATFSRRAVLNVGMLLRDSETAKKVRAYLLTKYPRPFDGTMSPSSTSCVTAFAAVPFAIPYSSLSVLTLGTLAVILPDLMSALSLSASCAHRGVALSGSSGVMRLSMLTPVAPSAGRDTHG